MIIYFAYYVILQKYLLLISYWTNFGPPLKGAPLLNWVQVSFHSAAPAGAASFERRRTCRDVRNDCLPTACSRRLDLCACLSVCPSAAHSAHMWLLVLTPCILCPTCEMPVLYMCGRPAAAAFGKIADPSVHWWCACRFVLCSLLMWSPRYLLHCT